LVWSWSMMSWVASVQYSFSHLGTREDITGQSLAKGPTLHIPQLC
jgi:hypothetical protein